ncbi:hypothetical protein NFA_19610 [Nocardia farcinica IFM 10152]|uniref:Uncharacterized protein n=2 Tax=Nocardia farcinica TaxID=37329 RepID=Q5YYD4_NOCFA|nr:hypothetical protein NFA_19610 [Nocardia farcinica IFM 10152]
MIMHDDAIPFTTGVPNSPTSADSRSRPLGDAPPRWKAGPYPIHPGCEGTTMFDQFIEPLQPLAEQNRDLIGFVVINLGNGMLAAAKWALEAATPILQQFFAK